MKTKYTVLILAVFLLSLLTFSISQAKPQFDSGQIISLANADRIANSLLPLRENQSLKLAADLKIDDMIANNYFGHISPAGIKPWYFFRKVDYKYANAGENLALNFADPKKVEQAWIQSPEHRMNILNPNFTDIGIAEREVTYKDMQTNFIVEYFGRQQSPERQ